MKKAILVAALGTLLLVGCQSTPSSSEFQQTKNRAEAGEAQAQYELATWYQSGEQSLKQSDEIAMQWYEKAAEQDHALAQTSLGFIYEQGYGVDVDYKQALQWYEKAASQWYEVAMYRLGRLYEFGLGVEQNYEQSAYWYRLAVDEESADA
ncbi:tetratricopeptide repeat protein [Vibrio sonorensis]|uniref:tetratricopeptide repeat protein n=1 Tax=Vibrio sonorensis TaxID=1004316 RepID=UPI0008DA0639|nr:tetratricopeptide repeat protein [Vibrio sonorensis]